ncbi:MAG: PA14 domain-containing protein, partial [Anaerolineae bacterium]|nr:PA14 domain-containing protein [Anaerolineae bacterium]
MARIHPQRRHGALVALAIVALLVGACQPTGTATPIPKMPFIAVAPERIPAGSPISAIGSDWQPGEEVTIGLLPTVPGQAGALVLAVVTADSQGRFRVELTAPLGLAPGPWQVTAQTRTPGRFAVASLTILEPTPLPPTATPPPTPTLQPTPTATTPPRQLTPTRPPRPTNTPLPPPPPTPPLPPIPAYPSWRGEYFDNINLSGVARVVRIDTPLDFNWGNSAPDPSIPADAFSARWTTLFGVAPGTYRFVFFVDDGVRLYIDNVLVLDEWQDGPPREVFRDVTMAGRTYTLRVEYYERTGFAALRFSVFGVPQFTPTPLPTPTPTRTPQPPTPTPVPPTPTFTPVPPTPLPTNTPLPTAVPLPTPTPIPLPTNTPVPTVVPLPTPTP